MTCSATVEQWGNNFEQRRDHVHEAQPNILLHTEVAAAVREQAVADVYVPAGKIVDDVLLEAVPDDPVSIPKPSNLMRAVSRARQRLKPKHPRCLSFQVSNL